MFKTLIQGLHQGCLAMQARFGISVTTKQILPDSGISPVRPYLGPKTRADVYTHIPVPNPPKPKPANTNIFYDDHEMVSHKIESSQTAVSDPILNQFLETKFIQLPDADKSMRLIQVLEAIVADPQIHTTQKINDLADFFAKRRFHKSGRPGNLFRKLSLLLIKSKILDDPGSTRPPWFVHLDHLNMMIEAKNLWDGSYGADYERESGFII